VTILISWQAIITVCAWTGVPCPLPVFDLSQKVFAHNTNAQKGEHAGTVTETPAREDDELDIHYRVENDGNDATVSKKLDIASAEARRNLES
jgi:hypothetical protein